MRRAMLLALALALASVAQDKPAIRQMPAPRTSPTSGEEMFKAYCAACHGLEGKGNGPAAAALNKTPTNLTELAARNKGQFPALRVSNAILGDANVMAHGSKDMPVWGQVFRSVSHDAGEVQLRLANLTKYVAGLQKKAVN